MTSTDTDWKSLAVKAAAGLAALAVAGFAAYKLSRRSGAAPAEESKAEAATGKTKGGKLTDVKDVMAKFAAAHPSQNEGDENDACAFYNSIDQATYDEFLTYINFTDPHKIA